MENENVIVLEPSTNTHTMKGKVVVSKTLENLNGLVIKTNGKGIVLHGEHGVIVTEDQNVIKLTQQECNPVTGMMQAAFD